MSQVQNAKRQAPTSRICKAMGLSRATLHRFAHPCSKPEMLQSPAHPRALNPEQRAEVLQQLTSRELCDVAPASAYAMLLDQGKRYCSVRTMYRILHANRSVQERRNQRRVGKFKKPELLAERPNQVWSWDITKLKGSQKWEYYHLYVMLDIFSRKVVGWMVCPNESGALATQLIATTYQRQGIQPNQVSIHSDRGPAMTSRPVSQLLQALDINKSFSRPHVSNDNPFSEAQFKTLKYRPEFPSQFGSLQDANGFLRDFFDWYNDTHRHSALGYMTPSSVHDGSATQLRRKRQDVLDAAYARTPERFVGGPPKAPALPTAAWINPPTTALAAPPNPQGQEVATSPVH